MKENQTDPFQYVLLARALGVQRPRRPLLPDDSETWGQQHPDSPPGVSHE